MFTPTDSSLAASNVNSGTRKAIQPGLATLHGGTSLSVDIPARVSGEMTRQLVERYPLRRLNSPQGHHLDELSALPAHDTPEDRNSSNNQASRPHFLTDGDRSAEVRPASSDSQLAEPADAQKFNTRSTYTSFGLITVYVALNAAVAHTLRDNPAAAIPVIYNLTGYLPQLAAQTYDSYKHDEALVLDATMYTKIIGAGVVEAVQVASVKYPHQMGLEGANKTAVATAWTMAAATVTDIAGRAIRRLSLGKPTIYSTTQDANRRDADQYVFYGDHLALSLKDAADKIRRRISDRLDQRTKTAVVLPTTNQEVGVDPAIPVSHGSESVNLPGGRSAPRALDLQDGIRTISSREERPASRHGDRSRDRSRERFDGR